MTRLMPVLAALILSACQLPAGGPGPRDSTAAAMADCPSYGGMQAVAAYARTHVIALGEAPHGTAESPQALYALACHLVEGGMPVRVGLEAPYTVSDALDAFLDHPDASREFHAASAGMWSVHDGRSSQAVLALLRHLGRLKAAGADVSVFAFDTAPEEYAGQANWGFGLRDARMAAHLDAAIEGHEGAVLLLTGRLHVRKKPLTLGAFELDSMAVAATARPFPSLEMLHDGGTAWVASEANGETVHGVVSLGDLLPDSAPERAFVLTPGLGAYDGAYYTGPITASPPAFPAAPAS